MTENELLTLRLESLKLAYQTAHHIGIFSRYQDYVHHITKNGKSFESDLEDVMELADVNLKYLLSRDELD